MITLRLILLLGGNIITAAAFASETIKLKKGQQVKVGDTLVTCSTSEIQPEKTSSCIDRDMAGKCIEWDYTYYLPGVSCTEMCRDRDPTGKCKVRDQCIVLASGLFRHKVCVDIGPTHNCREWSESIRN